MGKIWRSIFSKRMLAVLFMGFASGLPLLLIGGTLRAWMKDQGVDLTLIGLFALVGFPYTLKFLWAPLLDRFVPPFLDRRRGWIVICQALLAVCFVAMAFSNPAASPWPIAVIAFFVSLFSASQDIVVDAYRREILKDEELGFGSALAVNGYRLGLLLAGAGALPIADAYGWKASYCTMAVAMAVSLVFTILSPRVDSKIAPPKSLREAFVQPLVEYFSRSGAIEILVFILLFKIGDQMASDMLNPFYLDIGFTKTQIGVVSKLFGFWAVIAGGLIGGAVMMKMGIFRSLWVFGILQAASTVCFAVLATAGPSVAMLATVVSFENLSSGMGTAAYVGYMASLTDRRFTATQYALLSSLMGVPRVIFGSSSGYLAKHLGWPGFFLFCTVIAIPGLLLLLKLKPGPSEVAPRKAQKKKKR